MTNEQKSASPRGVINGDELTYTIKFKNEGSTTENADTKLHQLIFHDKPNSKIALNYTNVSAKVGTSTVSCTTSRSGTTLIIDFGNYALARAATLTITINATVNASTYTSSNIENAIELAQIKNRNGEDIKTILNTYDLTKNKDTYKIYAANSSENKRIAENSLPNLALGQDAPLVLGDLSIYTGLPRVDRTKIDAMRAIEKIRKR